MTRDEAGRTVQGARPRERDYWLALTRVVGIGPARFQRLIAFFGSAERAWQADPLSLEPLLSEDLLSDDLLSDLLLLAPE